jgi:hypothetical protein
MRTKGCNCPTEGIEPRHLVGCRFGGGRTIFVDAASGDFRRWSEPEVTRQAMTYFVWCHTGRHVAPFVNGECLTCGAPRVTNEDWDPRGEMPLSELERIELDDLRFERDDSCVIDEGFCSVISHDHEKESEG